MEPGPPHHHQSLSHSPELWLQDVVLKDSNAETKTTAPGKIRKKERRGSTEPSSAEPSRAQAPAEPSGGRAREGCAEPNCWHKILRGLLALLRLGWGDENISHWSSHGHTAFVWSPHQALPLGSIFSLVPSDTCPFVGGTPSFYILFFLYTDIAVVVVILCVNHYFNS